MLQLDGVKVMYFTTRDLTDEGKKMEHIFRNSEQN
jgi:hypothetical protein